MSWFHALALLMSFALGPSLAIFTCCAALYLICAGLAYLRSRWLQISGAAGQAAAEGRAADPLTEAEKETGALAAAVTCTLCRKDGTGKCECEIDCGHGDCTGDRPTIRAAWTPGELAILRGERELEQ